jgi:hypothetical protein
MPEASSGTDILQLVRAPVCAMVCLPACPCKRGAEVRYMPPPQLLQRAWLAALHRIAAIMQPITCSSSSCRRRAAAAAAARRAGAAPRTRIEPSPPCRHDSGHEPSRCTIQSSWLHACGRCQKSSPDEGNFFSTRARRRLLRPPLRLYCCCTRSS